MIVLRCNFEGFSHYTKGRKYKVTKVIRKGHSIHLYVLNDRGFEEPAIILIKYVGSIKVGDFGIGFEVIQT